MLLKGKTNLRGGGERGMTRPGVWLLPLVVLAGAFFLRVSDSAFAPRVANAVFDAYQQIAPRPNQGARNISDQSVRYIDVDAPSLARYGNWPWPRALTARLIERLQESGAALIVIAL